MACVPPTSVSVVTSPSLTSALPRILWRPFAFGHVNNPVPSFHLEIHNLILSGKKAVCSPRLWTSHCSIYHCHHLGKSHTYCNTLLSLVSCCVLQSPIVRHSI
ncbi:mCG147664 [Mus musculus]|nr:mCG147664 [Mus musculus]